MADVQLGETFSKRYRIQSDGGAYTVADIGFRPDYWEVINLTTNADDDVIRSYGYRGMTDAHAFQDLRILNDGGSSGRSTLRITANGFTLTTNAAGVDSSEAANNITGATAADPVVITLTAHGFNDGDIIRITDVVGMIELNNRRFRVNNSTANTFELQSPETREDIDGSNFTAYTSGGRANLLSRIDGDRDLLDAETYDLLLGTSIMDADDDVLLLTLFKYGEIVDLGDIA